MGKLKRIFTNWRILLVIIALVFSIIAIHPNFDKRGVVIKSVEPGSPANLAGIVSQDELSSLGKERVYQIQNIPIVNQKDYYSAIKDLKQGQTVKITTSKQTYTAYIKDTNRSTNFTSEDVLGLTISDVPGTNLVQGLDLQGGIRVILRPKEKINSTDYDTLIRILTERMNVQGLRDVVIRKTSNLVGEDFILIEIAGSTKREVSDLLARQGKFDAYVGDELTFTGQDVNNVCTSGTCSMIESCSQYTETEYGCRYRFSVTLSIEASQKRAQQTKNLPSITSPNGEEYLTKNITFMLDGEKISELLISSELRGSEATTTSISGYATGFTMEEARKNTVFEMEKLQTILYTGKLPVQLEIVDFSEVSPKLGQEFLNNSFLVAVTSLFVVSFLLYLRFRKLEVALPVIITMTSEIVLTLGFAAITKWNLDLASIAGIIVSTGTGVDDQIVITDEVMRGEKVDRKEHGMNIGKRIKNAFFMVFGAFSVTFVSMLPLYVAGAGQLKGFAFTTIVGISIGVFLTRPAFADLIKELLSDK